MLSLKMLNVISHLIQYTFLYAVHFELCNFNKNVLYMPIFKEVSPWKGLIENSLNMYIDYLHNSKYAQDEHVEINKRLVI